MQIPPLTSLAANFIIEQGFDDPKSLNEFLRFTHEARIILKLPYNKVHLSISAWFSHLYAIKYKYDLIDSYYHKKVSCMIEIRAHGGVVRYIRRALWLAEYLIKEVAVQVGFAHIRNGLAWYKSFSIPIPSSFNESLNVDNIHFDIAVCHFFEKIMK